MSLAIKRRAQLTALGLTGVLLTVSAPRGEAQTAAAAAIPCVASGVCVVIGTVVIGGIMYYQLRNNRTRTVFNVPTNGNYENHAYPQVRPGPNPNMQTQYNEPGKVEVHAVTHPDLCRQMEQKFLMQGRNLKLHRIRRTMNPGLRYDCEFVGPDAQEGWFHDRRGGGRR